MPEANYEDVRIRPTQYKAYGLLTLAMLGLTALARALRPALFQRFIGSLDPVLVILGAGLLGGLLLSICLSRGWFAIYRSGQAGGLIGAAGLAALFGVIIIMADFQIVHPRDMNVPLPDSLLFYPVVGFVVEVLFHLVPLVVVLTVLTSLFKHAQRETLLLCGIVLVALIEPTFQVVGSMIDVHAWGALAFDWLHIFLINLFQLLLFKRYDFVSMYAMRFCYYIIWHIVWGHVRLGVLPF